MAPKSSNPPNLIHIWAILNYVEDEGYFICTKRNSYVLKKNEHRVAAGGWFDDPSMVMRTGLSGDKAEGRINFHTFAARGGLSLEEYLEKVLSVAKDDFDEKSSADSEWEIYYKKTRIIALLSHAHTQPCFEYAVSHLEESQSDFKQRVETNEKAIVAYAEYPSAVCYGVYSNIMTVVTHDVETNKCALRELTIEYLSLGMFLVERDYALCSLFRARCFDTHQVSYAILLENAIDHYPPAVAYKPVLGILSNLDTGYPVWTGVNAKVSEEGYVSEVRVVFALKKEALGDVDSKALIQYKDGGLSTVAVYLYNGLPPISNLMNPEEFYKLMNFWIADCCVDSHEGYFFSHILEQQSLRSSG